MRTVLIVEDNAFLRNMVRDYLAEHGYRVRVASDGAEGLLEARHEPPDLVLLDVMMPRMDGLEFLRRFRTIGVTPVLCLSAKDREVDKVLGLELGADDYVTKPFSMAELLARVRALLRRADAPAPIGGVVRAGEVELDPAARRCRVRGAAVHLTRSEFDLLELLARHPRRVFTRAELLEHLQEDAFGSGRTVNAHVRNLRAKIEADPSAPRLVETVFGVGYRLDPGPDAEAIA